MNILVFIRSLSSSKSLKVVLESVKNSLRDYNYEVLVSTDNPDREGDLTDGVKYVYHGSESGINAIRNDLLTTFRKYTYLLKLDDDFELGGEFDIRALLIVMGANNNIKVVTDLERQIGWQRRTPSGMLRPYAYSLVKLGTTLFKISRSWSIKKNKKDSVKYSCIDYGRNLLLIDTTILDSISWNKDILFKGEHLSFYWDLKQHGYQSAVSLSSVHYHRDDYKKFAGSFNGVKQSQNEIRFQ